jgi:hypothetical protein
MQRRFSIPARKPARRIVSVAFGALLALGSLAAGIAAADEADTRAKSQALFLQMASVFASPRCMNCHPRAAFPTQGDDRHRHTMNVARGPDDHGAPGLHCGTCHQATNQAASGVPGAPDWQLAPLRMAWDGYTAGELCRALLDPARGGMKPDQFVDHFNTAFVRWAWAPGIDAHGTPRTVPPIPHDQFVALTQQWVATGAACPK